MARPVWAGLDVGVETTSVCVIDHAGAVLHQTLCTTALRSVDRELRWIKRRRLARVGLEAGTGISLARGLRTLGYTVDIYEARQLSKFLRSRRTKTDAGDASGIAEAGRIGVSTVSKVHLKSFEFQSLQSRLTIRRHLIGERVAAVNLLCRQVELYGGRVQRSTRAAHLRQDVERELKRLFGRKTTALTAELRNLLDHCESMVMRQQVMDEKLNREAHEIEICRRFMQIPGVGPMCALTFYAAIEEPERFHRSSNVGAYLGLTPTVHQSGLTKRSGRITKMGHRALRCLLVQSSMILMRSNVACSLRDWALDIEKRRGRGRARVALARKLAIVMLRMWKTGEAFAA